MDTITLAGPLEAKLDAIQNAGFSQVMLKANDLAGHPQGWQAAVKAIRSSGLRGTGFQVLRDFEGLSGHLHQYKVDIAKTMLEMCAALGCEVMLACSSTSTHATADLDAIARDLRKLAMLAVPFGIRVAYEALSWGRAVNEYTTAWDVVCRADCPNLGLARLVSRAGRELRARCHRRARAVAHFPGPAVGLHVAGNPDVRGAHRHRAYVSRVSRRGRAHAAAREIVLKLDAWVMQATTASRSSTTTTSSCRCRWSPSVRGYRRFGWPRTCCAARRLCPEH